MDLILDVPMRDGDDEDLATLLIDGAEEAAPGDVCPPSLRLPGEAYHRAGVDVGVISSSVLVGSAKSSGKGKHESINVWKSPTHERRLTSPNCVKYNKVINRLPNDDWKEDGDVFRRAEEKKRTENLQQAVIDCNNNGWTHTKLFFSHCW